MSEPRRPILVYVTEEERAALQVQADRDGRTLQEMARELLQRALGL